jgi:hypothetical protein
MTDAEWSSDAGELATPPKKRIPGWLWGCGAGCLLFTIVAVLALVVVGRFASKMFDQDAQWEQIATVLPVSERPPGITVFGMPVKLEGTSMWFLTDTSRAMQGVLFHSPPSADAGKTRSELLDPSQEVSVGGFGRNDPQAGQVEVQGRVLPCLRYKSMSGEAGKGPFGGLQRAMQGSSLVVDLAAEGSDELLALILTKSGTSQPVTDQELREFLAPFHIPGGTPDPVTPSPTPPAQGGEEDR